MNNSTQWQIYAELEQLPPAIRPAAFIQAPITRWFNQLHRLLSSRLIAGENPRIWDGHDAVGTPCRFVFDPTTGRTMTFRTNQEFLDWLPRRFCQAQPIKPRDSKA
ncbi:MAG: hypothetical protein KME20_04820 [Kaiparowitsia implicata GSE-PSE-MK54-09C]|jgi:hypothetical protein|nr:hypothetical protein [Kaiparowitsia implicata GSE-PSE-MK54-09C]